MKQKRMEGTRKEKGKEHRTESVIRSLAKRNIKKTEARRAK